jgi:hypothetical protein
LSYFDAEDPAYWNEVAVVAGNADDVVAAELALAS